MFTPLELRAKHRNADADVESDTTIVSPTRVETIKRFMIGPFQFRLINVSTPKRRELIVNSAAAASSLLHFSTLQKSRRSARRPG